MAPNVVSSGSFDGWFCICNFVTCCTEQRTTRASRLRGGRMIESIKSSVTTAASRCRRPRQPLSRGKAKIMVFCIYLLNLHTIQTLVTWFNHTIAREMIILLHFYYTLLYCSVERGRWLPPSRRCSSRPTFRGSSSSRWTLPPRRLHSRPLRRSPLRQTRRRSPNTSESFPQVMK